MLRAFGEHAFEAKFNELGSEVVEVNQLCVTYNLRLNAETVAENRGGGCYLGGEFLGVGERRKAV